MIRFSFPIKLWSSKSKTHENWNCSVFLQFTGAGGQVKIIFNLFSRHILASMRVQVKIVQNTYLRSTRVIIVKTIWKLKYVLYLFNFIWIWIWNRSTLPFESNARPEKVCHPICLYEVVLGTVKYREINQVSYLSYVFYFCFCFEFYSESNSISKGPSCVLLLICKV